MTPTLTQRIFAAIPDAHTVWPEWFSPVCNEGHYLEASIAQERNNAPVLVCLKCKKDVAAPVWKFDPPTDGQGEWALVNGDLEHPQNLWAVWVIAELVAAGGEVQIMKWGFLTVYRTAFYRARIGNHYADGGTPQHALLAAIAAALGIKR